MVMRDEQLESIVQEKRNNIRGDRLDMSFGEIMNLYEDRNLIISPEYQRAYRWTDEKKTGFIESILLGIPFPPIFVSEDKDGKWELVDGLQRLSTVLSFFGLLKENQQTNNFALEKGGIINDLEGKNKDDISLKLQNTIKRAICRIEILRWDSNFNIKYELFKRLNTAGEPLAEQEVRNCIFRGNDNQLNNLLKELSQNEKFKEIADIREEEERRMFGEELILRIFCFQNSYEISNKLSDHLTLFMKNVTENQIDFNFKENKKKIIQLLEVLERDFFKGGGSRTLLSHRLWDAIWYPLYKNGRGIDIENFVDSTKEEIKEARISTTAAHKDRPKKAIEIGNKVYQNLKNGN